MGLAGRTMAELMPYCKHMAAWATGATLCSGPLPLPELDRCGDRRLPFSTHTHTPATGITMENNLWLSIGTVNTSLCILRKRQLIFPRFLLVFAPVSLSSHFTRPLSTVWVLHRCRYNAKTQQPPVITILEKISGRIKSVKRTTDIQKQQQLYQALFGGLSMLSHISNVTNWSQRPVLFCMFNEFWKPYFEIHGKSERFDNCDWPSNLTQLGFKSLIF